MIFMEQTLTEALDSQREENELLKAKIFIMEQTLIKKDNILMYTKKKREEKDFDIDYEREIYILEPSKAIVEINDELLMYKQIYDSLINHIKDIRESLVKAELLVSELQKENSKLRIQFKYHLLTSNKEKETLINVIQNERLSSQHTRHLTDNGFKLNVSQNNSNSNNNTSNNNSNNICKTDNIGIDLEMYKKINLKRIDQTKYENEDFMEILKSNNLNQSEFVKLSKNKLCMKLTEVIEMLYGLLKDKNMSLNLLKEEFDKLTTKNFQLNKDNMVLFQQNIELKKQSANGKSMAASGKNKARYDDSLINNNTSQLTTNQNVFNAISTYHKFIKLEEKKKEIGIDSFERDQQSSEHESIVNMKNVREYSNDLNEDTTNVSKDKDKKVLERDGNAMIMKNNHINDNNKDIMTMESVTSSEFREGFKDANSFLSTIRDNRCDNEGNENKEYNDKGIIKEQDIDLNMVKIKSTNL